MLRNVHVHSLHLDLLQFNYHNIFSKVKKNSSKEKSFKFYPRNKDKKTGFPDFYSLFFTKLSLIAIPALSFVLLAYNTVFQVSGTFLHRVIRHHLRFYSLSVVKCFFQIPSENILGIYTTFTLPRSEINWLSRWNLIQKREAAIDEWNRLEHFFSSYLFSLSIIVF